MVRLGLGPEWPGVLPPLDDPQNQGVPDAISRGDGVMPVRGWSRKEQGWRMDRRFQTRGHLRGPV